MKKKGNLSYLKRTFGARFTKTFDIHRVKHKRHLLERKNNRDKYAEANEGKEQKFKNFGLKILRAQQVTKLAVIQRVNFLKILIHKF